MTWARAPLPEGQRNPDVARFCESCNGMSVVIDSRDSAWEKAVRRRRKCVDCQARWTTYELNATDMQTLHGEHDQEQLTQLRDHARAILQLADSLDPAIEPEEPDPARLELVPIAYVDGELLDMFPGSELLEEEETP